MHFSFFSDLRAATSMHPNVLQGIFDTFHLIKMIQHWKDLVVTENGQWSKLTGF